MMTATAATEVETESIPTDLYIGGSWRPGANGRVDVVNPSDESVIATVADASVADGTAAVDAAASAAAAWAATAPRRRAEILRRCFELMTEQTERIARLIALENGKTLADARGEVAYAAEFFRWYSEEAVRVIGDISLSPNGANRIIAQHRPIGICVLVTPWNFPAAMATRKIAPALAAGCTTILKPALQTPLTAFFLAQLMAEAGVPAGVVNVVTTSTPGPVVSAMLHDPRVRKLSFTGSTQVGRTLLHESADQILATSMELGGNAPFIVFADADLPSALDGLMVAKMRNGGQACTAANRIYVERPIMDRFATALAERMAGLLLGPGTDPASGCGPLIDAPSLQKVGGLVEDAIDRGARTVLGGGAVDRPGYYYPPTVLADVPVDARLLAEEIFGPVAALVAFDTDDEVVRAANATEYGLSAYVYSGDLKRGLAIAERLESGMVAVNRGLVSDPAAPFGGVKQSGLGREGAHAGLLEFTETQYVAIEW
jgi:succinate-semialdehyde dehydrogenase/glutarate-semialdehyde dehydrogenase